MADEPIDGYDEKTVDEVQTTVEPYTNGLNELSDSDVVDRLNLVTDIYRYENNSKDRKTAKEAIKEVKDELEAEADSRDLGLDEVESTPDDGAESGDEDDDEDGTDDDSAAADGSETEATEDDAADGTSDARGQGISPIHGNDGTNRVLVRNHRRQSANVAGHGFDAGEVKELVLNDRIRQAIRENDLQVVSG